jgi:hypothetical protein
MIFFYLNRPAVRILAIHHWKRQMDLAWGATSTTSKWRPDKLIYFTCEAIIWAPVVVEENARLQLKFCRVLI